MPIARALLSVLRRCFLPSGARVLALALVGALFSLPAGAAGIGKGQLKSGFGQPLDAEFEVFGHAGEPVTDRCFRLIAPLDQAPGPEDITRAQLSLAGEGSGKRQLRVFSNSPVVEPVVRITLELSCGTTRIVRSFTFLPDLPSETPGEGATGRSRSHGTTAPAAPAAAEVATSGDAKPAAGAPAPARSGRQRASRPREDLTSLRLDGAPPPRRRAGDRLSLSALADLQRDAFERPAVLRISPALSLFSGTLKEKTPAQEALLALERRLAERAEAMTLGNYDTRQRLRELTLALEEARELAKQLPEGVELPVAQPATADAPPPVAAPAAPAPAAVAELPPVRPSTSVPPPASERMGMGVRIAVIALVALLGVLLGWLAWRRSQSKEVAQRPLSEHWTQPPEASVVEQPLFRDTPEPQPVGRAAVAQSRDDFDEAHAAGIVHPRDMIESISVSHGFENDFDDQFAAHLEAAEIMICFGRFQSAATEVADFIDENPECGLRPRLALLDIYRRGNLVKEFDQLADALVAQFNIMRPKFASEPGAASQSRNLDAFPHIVATIAELWGTPECLPYIRHLTIDNRGGTRVGFDFEAAEELALLESILKFRADQQAIAA